MVELVYPQTRQDDCTEDYHGVKIADPYRWLENPDSEETQAWVQAQNQLTSTYFDQNLAFREDLKNRLTKGYNFPKYSCYYKRGNYYYFSKNDGLQNQSVIYQQRSLDSEPTVFFDPNNLTSDGTAAIRSQQFSPDGSLFAYGISYSGSDWQTIYVMDCETLRKFDDKVDWSKFSGISWTHDNKGFFYCRYSEPAGLENDDVEVDAKRGSEVDKAENQQVFYHVLGSPQTEDVFVFGSPEHPTWMFGTEISDDGEYLLLTPSDGCMPVNRLYYERLATLKTYRDLNPVKLIDNFDASYEYITNEGTLFWFKTNLNAPKYRVIQIDIANPDEINWKEIVPEKEDVLQSVSCVHNDKLAVIYMHDVKELLSIYSLDGQLISHVDLPDLGSISSLAAKKEHSEFFYKFESFVYPATIFRFDCQSMTATIFKETEVPGHNPSDFESRQEFFPSKDGTLVPMFVVSRKGIEKNGQNPVYLYGYGGFSISLTPGFSAFRCEFIKSFNAILAIPNIRGGAEYGEDWHVQAIKEKRQTAFDDFISAAEFLIKEGYTNPSKIAISGGSNGGLLVATCANQRPDLFRCVVSQVPVADMLRFHKFTIGHAWCTDYGCSDNESEFKALYAYSPIHNIRGGTQYPAILVTTADHDDRVVPLHSYKLISALQQTLGSTNELPLLIRIDVKAGHGAGKPTSKAIEEVSEIFAFIAHTLGLQIQPY